MSSVLTKLTKFRCLFPPTAFRIKISPTSFHQRLSHNNDNTRHTRHYSSNKKEDPNTNYAVFGTGIIIGICGFMGWSKQQQQQQENKPQKEITRKVQCSPEDTLCLKYPLKSIISPEPSIQGQQPSKNDQKRHDFKYSHTLDGVGIEVLAGQPLALQQAKERSYDQWRAALFNLFGKDEYREVKVRHVVLTAASKIEKELKILAQNKLNAIPKLPGCFWLSSKRAIATIVYDDCSRQYRIYIYVGAVMIQCEKDDNGNYTIPIGIKFIAENADANMRNEYIDHVVEHFDADWESWRQSTTFIK